MTDIIVEVTNAEYKPCTEFDSMGLPESLLRGVYAHGFEKPSPIQSVAVMPIAAGRDILGQAQSGTGKTGAFSIGCLSRVNPELKKVQLLVIVHTHELAEQIRDEIVALSRYMNIGVVLAVGGEPRHLNVREIRAGACVVIGTPGRIYDLAIGNDLPFGNLRNFVLDEADEMLQDRFAEQVGEIVNIGLPAECKVALFSATLPGEVKDLAEKILKSPVRITLKEEEVKLNGITQYVVPVEKESWKVECFCDIIESIKVSQAILFVNTKENAEALYNTLSSRNFPVGVVYGSPMTQAVRKQRMKDFRAGKTRMLIASNMLARGIDVQSVDMVFNFEIPPFEEKETYIHRIGRCGRFGRKGVTIAFLTPTEQEIMSQIGEHFKFEVKALPADMSLIN
jgi:translation initiation factor 4A